MIITHPYNNVICFSFDRKRDLASMFLRMQEFYESPFPEINGKYFTLDTYKNIYCEWKKKSEFTYYDDWSGFNIPGHSLRRFLIKFLFDLSPEEKKFFKQIPLSLLLSGKKFYVIGCLLNDESTFIHETAHAFYYLNDNYKQEMDYYIGELSLAQLVRWSKKLEKDGYSSEVFNDEVQAYSVCKGSKEFKRIFDYYLNEEDEYGRP